MVVADAHLGSADRADEEAFHDFVEAVPLLGDALLVVGDLFDFWFEYRSVVPRRPFRTVAKLAALVERGVPVTVFGGNHDRWGGSFWARDLGIPFYGDGADLDVAGRLSHVAHGDGLAELKLGSRLLHRITRLPATVALFRALHPDLGFSLAHLLSDGLAETNRTEEAIRLAAAAVEAYARALLDRRPELELVVFGHTHRTLLVEHAPGRFYLNPGQWLGDHAYAVVTPDRIALARWPERA